MQHYNNVPWSQKKKWRLLWTLILGTPHIGANITVTLSLAPITMHLSPSLQVSQSATTQCMMTQICSSACNTPYDLRCVASYQPPPSYFYPTGKTRASINAYRALVRDNPIYCITLGYIPKTKLTYAMPTSWEGVQRNFPYHTWTWIL